MKLDLGKNSTARVQIPTEANEYQVSTVGVKTSIADFMTSTTNARRGAWVSYHTRSLKSFCLPSHASGGCTCHRGMNPWRLPRRPFPWTPMDPMTKLTASIQQLYFRKLWHYLCFNLCAFSIVAILSCPASPARSSAVNPS